MQDVLAVKVLVLQGLPWFFEAGGVALITGDSRRLWRFQALGNPSA
jgi:hypothetical protein